MSRPKCAYLGPLEPGRGLVRACNHPERGGTCEQKKECARCPLHTAGALTIREERPATPTRIALPCLYDDGPCASPDDKRGTQKTFIDCEKRGPICKCECGEGKCSLYLADDPDAM